MTLPAEAAGSAPGRGRADGAAAAGGRRGDAAVAGAGSAWRVTAGHLGAGAREGVSVACADRDTGAAEATAVLVRDEGQAAAVVLADVTAPEACASMIAESAAALGGNDGLVLNAGIGRGRGMAGTTAAAVGPHVRGQYQDALPEASKAPVGHLQGQPGPGRLGPQVPGDERFPQRMTPAEDDPRHDPKRGTISTTITTCACRLCPFSGHADGLCAPRRTSNSGLRCRRVRFWRTHRGMRARFRGSGL